MNDVYVKKCTQYDLEKIKQTISEGFDALGGIEAFIKPGESVLIKPNCLLNAAPETGITTHPVFLQAVIQIVKTVTDKIIVGDSPGFGSFKGVSGKNGMRAVTDAENVELIEFKADTQIDVPDKLLYGTFMIDSRVKDVDKIISLPKFKTHMLMYMTLCVKNMFGLIAGLKKVEFHAKAERDKRFFAQMLVDLYRAKSPNINIVDGILGLHGNGPGTDGKPIKSEVIVMGVDGFATDVVLADIAMIDPYRVHTNVAYKDADLKGEKIQYNILGDSIESVRVKFEPPPVAVGAGAFRNIIYFVRGNVVMQPKFEKKNCTGCKVCVEHCPVNCWEKIGPNVIKCDYSKCISCFCCHEMCPDKAISIKKPFLSFLFR
jgi:uncharacterized protein (DUF362 family)/Pyruvate/2-oxoacid:ferredoxin oxidoreductase delta subunit